MWFCGAFHWRSRQDIFPTPSSWLGLANGGRNDSVPVSWWGLKRPWMFLHILLSLPWLVSQKELSQTALPSWPSSQKPHTRADRIPVLRGAKPSQDHGLLLTHRGRSDWRVIIVFNHWISRWFAIQQQLANKLCYHVAFAWVGGTLQDSREGMVLGTSDQDITSELV